MFGWKKDPYKSKDYKFSQLKPKLVTTSSSGEHIIPEICPIYDQLTLSSCVANATVGAFEILMGLSNQKYVPLSRLFVYWNARLYNKETKIDDGTYIRNAFDSLQTLGVCLESAWGYNSQKVFNQPSLEAFKQGDDNTINSFYRISQLSSQRVDDIETAVRANHPVVFGTAVSKEFTQYKGSSKIWGPPPKWVGYHAMVVVGIRIADTGRREFLIRNSWGTDWGDNGHTWFDEDYLAWYETEDLWVATMMPVLTI